MMTRATIASMLLAISFAVIKAEEPGEMSASRGSAVVKSQSAPPSAIDLIADEHVMSAQLVSYGEVHEKQQDWKSAADCWKQVVALQRSLYGNDSVLTAEALERHGHALRELRDWETATSVYEESLSIRLLNSDGISPEVARDLESLALIQFEQNCFSSAEPLFERFVAMMRRIEGDDSQTAAFAEFLIGVCQMRGEQHISAIVHFERALSSFQKSPSPDISGIESCLAALCYEYGQVSDLRRARARREELSILRLQRFGSAIAEDDLAHLPVPLPAGLKLPLDGRHLVGVLERLAEQKVEKREWGQVRIVREQIAEVCRNVYGKDSAATADALEQLGRAWIELKEWNAARNAFLESLAIRDVACCGMHPDIADSLERLIQIELEQKNYAGAIPHMERRLAVIRGLSGNEDTATVRALLSLGNAYRHSGDHRAGIPCFETALAAMRSMRRTSDPDFEACLKVLCAEYVQVRDFYRARPLVKELVDAWKRRQRSGDLNDLKQLVELGSLHFMTKDASAARPFFEEALAGLQVQVGADDQFADEIHWNLGLCLQLQGLSDRAITHIAESLRIREAAHGEFSTKSADANSMLGRMQMEAGNLLPALICYENALEIEETLELRDDLVIGDIHARLGRLLLVAELPGSFEHLDRALQIRRTCLGSNHLETADVLHWLGDSLCQMGHVGAAQPRYIEALQIRRRQLGNRHLDTANTLASLGIALLRERCHSAARNCLEEALFIRRLRLGDDHAETRYLVQRLQELPAKPSRDLSANVSAE